VTLLLYFALGGAMYFSLRPDPARRLFRDAGGAALLPFALIMGFGASFAGAVSDVSGAAVADHRAIIAGCGLALLAFADLGKSYWIGVFRRSACLRSA